jgi:hypothetical protein
VKRAPDRLRRGLEIHQPSCLAELEMLARGLVEGRGVLAETQQLLVLRLGRAVGHVVGRQVGQFRQHRSSSAASSASRASSAGISSFRRATSAISGAGILAARLRDADRLGGLVAALLQLLQLGSASIGARRPGPRIDWARAARPTPGEAVVEAVGLLADGSDVVHARFACGWNRDRGGWPGERRQARPPGTVSDWSAVASVAACSAAPRPQPRLVRLLALAACTLGQLGGDDRDLVEQDHRDREADLADHVGRRDDGGEDEDGDDGVAPSLASIGA